MAELSTLRILVTGFPNSGTSFLCNLFVAMGFHPGSEENLKPADDHNRYGYWEHLPIRKELWPELGNIPSLHIPHEPVDPRRKVVLEIERLVEEDHVGVDHEELLHSSSLTLARSGLRTHATRALARRRTAREERGGGWRE